MTPLLGHPAAYAGLAIIGLSAVSQAQIPARPEPVPVRQEPAVGGELRRAVPAAGAPTVQQSPNGLYALSITDDGIELRGPSGGVKITNAGMEIGAPNGSRVTISAVGMELWGDKALKLNARESVEIVNGPGANIVRLSPAGMELTGKGLVQVKGVGTVEIGNGTGPGMNAVRLSTTGLEIGNGTGPGMNAVRLSSTGMELNTGGTVQLKAAGTLQIINGKGPATNSVTLSNAGMVLKGGQTVEITNGPGPANIVRLSNGVELTAGSASVKVASGETSLTGRVALGCPGGKPAARAGDAVGVNSTTGSGGIMAGSTKVLICD